MKKQPWSRAIEIAGGQKALAAVIGVDRQWIWKYQNEDRPCPPHHVLKLEAATGIPRHEWRADIYPVAA